MNNIKQFYDKHISETKRLKDYPIFSIIFFFPASIITAILIIPVAIITYPFVYVFKKQESTIVKVGLYIQHSLGLSAWFIIEETLLANIFSVNWSFGVSEIIINALIALIVFYNSIKEMIHENLTKVYGDNWKV